MQPNITRTFDNVQASGLQIGTSSNSPEEQRKSSILRSSHATTEFSQLLSEAVQDNSNPNAPYVPTPRANDVTNSEEKTDGWQRCASLESSGSTRQIDENYEDKEEDDADSTKSKHVRPPYSYIALITMALNSAENNMMTLNDIYKYIMAKFPYFRNNLSRWQNSIRHNLSLNDCFVRLAKQPGRSGKGNFWTLHPKCGDMFSNGSFLRRPKRFRAMKAKTEWAQVQHVNSYNHFSLYGTRDAVPPNYNFAYYQQAPCTPAYTFNGVGGYGPTISQPAPCSSTWSAQRTPTTGRSMTGYHYGLPTVSSYYASPNTGYFGMAPANPASVSANYPTFHSAAYPLGVNSGYSFIGGEPCVQQS